MTYRVSHQREDLLFLVIFFVIFNASHCFRFIKLNIFLSGVAEDEEYAAQQSEEYAAL